METINRTVEETEEEKKLIKQTLNKMSTVVVGAAWTYPMLSRGLYAMEPVVVIGLKEMSGGSCWGMDEYGRVYVDPRVFFGPDKEEMKTSIASFIHETWHWLRLHPARMKCLSPNEKGKKVCQKRSNIAMDMAINGDDPFLRKHLHDYNVWPENFTDTRTGKPFDKAGGLSWEEYYRYTDWGDEEDDEETEGGQTGGQTSEDPEGNSEGNSEGQTEEENSEGDSGQGDTPKKETSPRDSPDGDDPNDVWTGENPWELGPKKKESGEDEEIRKAVARSIQESSRAQGVSKGWGIWAQEEIEVPKIPWEEKLARFVEDSHDSVAGCSNFTYSKRSRRQGLLGSNVIIPAVYHPRCEVAVVIDTSGSMSDKDLKSCVEETSGILDAMGASAMVVTGDTHIGFAERISDITNISLVGRGGTDMRPMIRRAMEEPEIQAVIVMTDGYTGWVPENELRVPAVVCLIGRHCGESRIPNYMTTIVVED